MFEFHVLKKLNKFNALTVWSFSWPFSLDQLGEVCCWFRLKKSFLVIRWNAACMKHQVGLTLGLHFDILLCFSHPWCITCGIEHIEICLKLKIPGVNKLSKSFHQFSSSSTPGILFCSLTLSNFSHFFAMEVSTDITTEPAAKRGKASPSHIEVSVSLGLAGRTVSLSVPRQIQVSDLRAQIALASPDFEHEMSLILGDREVEDTEQLSELQVAQTLDAETTWCGLEFTAVRDDGRRIRQKLKQKVREFQDWCLIQDFLCFDYPTRFGIQEKLQCLVRTDISRFSFEAPELDHLVWKKQIVKWRSMPWTSLNIFELISFMALIHVCPLAPCLSKTMKNPRFDHYDLDRLCREGDPELQEELWGSDMEALYRKNDELIDQLGIADLRDMEAHYRLVQRHGMRITCKSCCSSLGPGCLIWDLTGHLRVIGHYWNFLRQNGKAAAHSSLKRLKKVSRVNDPTHSALSDEFWQVHLY